MAAGLTPSLLAAALTVGVLGFLLLGRYLSPLPALLVVLVKIALPVVYFGWYYDGSWHFLDDVTYWNQGKLMLAAGYDPLSALLRADGIRLLMSVTLGPHILYGWWNLLGQYLFGPHYHAAVFLNVGLTFLSGALLFGIARRAGFSRRYAQGLLIFYLLHWELLAWSSFLNLKDVMVSTLALAAIFFFLRLVTESPSAKAKLINAAALVGVLFAFPWIRFYIPLLLLASFGFWMVLTVRGRKRYALLAGAALLLLVVPLSIPTQYLMLNPAAMVAGVLKSPLTPRPWAIIPEYGFLLLPATIHWLLFLPALAGGFLLWRRSRVATLVLIFLLAVTSLSAIAPEFQGPRHRVQVLFGWAWIQFHIVYCLLAARVSRQVAGPERPERPERLRPLAAGAGVP